MAPTICADKDDACVLRDSRKYLNTSVINYVGRISHNNRSISALNQSITTISSNNHITKTISKNSSQKKIYLKKKNIVNNNCIGNNCDADDTNKSSKLKIINNQPDDEATTHNFNLLTLDTSSSDSSQNSDDLSQNNVIKFNNRNRNTKSQQQNKRLFEIAMQTVKLIKRHQLLQIRLAKLKKETQTFVKSVLVNAAENDVICNYHQ